MHRWKKAVALAKEIERARRLRATIDPEMARTLAGLVLAHKYDPTRDVETPVERESVLPS